MKQSDDNHIIPMTSVNAGKGVEVLPDVYCYTNQIVNVIFLGLPNAGDWVLVDAGMPKSGSTIIKVAEERSEKEQNLQQYCLHTGILIMWAALFTCWKNGMYLYMPMHRSFHIL